MKIPERYDDASSGRWQCWWWRVIQLPICQPQRGGRATTDCSTLVQRKPQSFPWNPNPRLVHTLQCSAVLRLLQPPEVAKLVLCWRKCCTRDVCSVLYTNISQCSVTAQYVQSRPLCWEYHPVDRSSRGSILFANLYWILFAFPQCTVVYSALSCTPRITLKNTAH